MAKKLPVYAAFREFPLMTPKLLDAVIARNVDVHSLFRVGHWAITLTRSRRNDQPFDVIAQKAYADMGYLDAPWSNEASRQAWLRGLLSHASNLEAALNGLGHPAEAELRAEIDAVRVAVNQRLMGIQS